MGYNSLADNAGQYSFI